MHTVTLPTCLHTRMYVRLSLSLGHSKLKLYYGLCSEQRVDAHPHTRLKQTTQLTCGHQWHTKPAFSYCSVSDVYPSFQASSPLSPLAWTRCATSTKTVTAFLLVRPKGSGSRFTSHHITGYTYHHHRRRRKKKKKMKRRRVARGILIPRLAGTIGIGDRRWALVWPHTHTHAPRTTRWDVKWDLG